MDNNIASSLIAANITALIAAIITITVPLVMIWTIKLYNLYIKKKRSKMIFKSCKKDVEVVSFDNYGLPTYLKYNGEILSLEDLYKKLK